MDCANLTDHFLIAMPTLVDSFFSKSVVYICEHSEQGALGIIINRPIDMNLGSLFEKIDIEIHPELTDFISQPVYFGGPVHMDRGFVLHRPVGSWQSTLTINERIGLTSSRDILQAAAAEGHPADFLVTLGVAGWEPGQLEEEIKDNAWLTVSASPQILFETHFNQRLDAAMQLLGIDLLKLSNIVGHA